ncbi:AAA domain-containing protein, partial [Dissulfurirhabdus thermomarina]
RSPAAAGERGGPIDFSLKPEELEAWLDRYVVGQREAKAVLATKICTHFRRVRLAQERGGATSPAGHIKNNIILIGPTGVGKTFLLKLIAAKIGVPFVKADATKFSETGYVGGDVEDLVRELVDAAGGDIERAQYGIVYIDEIDKIAAPYTSHGPDVSRSGVQRALLKLLEETQVDLRVPHDPVAQLEAIERYRRSGRRERQVVNTRDILFIVSGAFAGLSEIVKRRLSRSGIGFGAELRADDDQEWLRHVIPQDLVEYGFESEFVGRLPVVACLHPLDVDDLHAILQNPDGAVTATKRQDFRAYGIDLRFEDEALRLLAAEAHRQGTGARALVSVVERALLPFEKRLPSLGADFLVVTPELVRDPEAELERIAADPGAPDRRAAYEALVARQRSTLVERLRAGGEVPGWEDADLPLTETRLRLIARLAMDEDLPLEEAGRRIRRWIEQIRRYEAAFEHKCGIRITFDEAAADALLEAGGGREVPLYTQCERLCNILEYGLPLIHERCGRKAFRIPAEAVENPELYINRLIRECYPPDPEDTPR